MRTALDFSPFYRSTVGFDRMFDLLANVDRVEPIDDFPPYDIERRGEDTYRITLAVAGFSESDLTVTAQQNLLIVAGRKAEEPEQQLLHRGIKARSFEQRFELADYVKVTGARLNNGLLSIDLVRELPQEMRPRQIPITTAGATPALEQAPQAA